MRELRDYGSGWWFVFTAACGGQPFPSSQSGNPLRYWSMKTPVRRSAFTLIEVLIVVVIMAILAATIIPQFTDSTKDAKQSTVRFNVHTLRSQIELYRTQRHSGRVDGQHRCLRRDGKRRQLSLRPLHPRNPDQSV